MTTDNIKYYLLVTANPLLDSVGAISIFKLIKRLDRFSREIEIFLPGFHVSEKTEPDSKEEIIQKMAADLGLSVNAFINQAIDEKIQKQSEQ